MIQEYLNVVLEQLKYKLNLQDLLITIDMTGAVVLWTESDDFEESETFFDDIDEMCDHFNIDFRSLNDE